jgi:hypothetical protein
LIEKRIWYRVQGLGKRLTADDAGYVGDFGVVKGCSLGRIGRQLKS